MLDIVLNNGLEAKKQSDILDAAVKIEIEKYGDKVEDLPTDNKISFKSINENIRIDYANSDNQINLKILTPAGVKEYVKSSNYVKETTSEVKTDKKIIIYELQKLVDEFDTKFSDLLKRKNYHTK